jgi:AcrR family transcriptional regulator
MKQDTRAGLIKAASRTFARHGFNGASVREITRAAHANLGAITYHFGSKRKLYETVLETSANPLADAAIAAAAGPGAPRDRVAAVVRVYFNYLADHPEVGQLLLQELVLGRTPPEATVVPIKRIHGALTGLVMDGQEQGDFRAGDPRVLAIGIISQPVHMNLLRNPLRVIAGIDIEDAGAREGIIQTIVQFVCAGLSAEAT